MRVLLFISCCFFSVGCTKKVSKDDLRYLNGYWEIQKVKFSDGTIKEYKNNITLDYIEIEGLKGFRKKVNPKFDGTYHTSDDAELFTISEASEGLWLYYENDLSSWKEQLIALGADNFSVLNEEGITYQYKRFEPIDLTK